MRKCAHRGFSFLWLLLVVDDDPAIRNLIHRFLSKKDYQLKSAGDGRSALTIFDEFDPDLVIFTGDQIYELARAIVSADFFR